MKHLGLDESHCTMTDICGIYLLPKAFIVRKKKNIQSAFFFRIQRKTEPRERVMLSQLLDDIFEYFCCREITQAH